MSLLGVCCILNIEQLRLEIIQPALERIGLGGKAAEDLCIATGQVESGYEYLRQVGGGPALGFWQMEPLTHDDIWNNFLAFRGPLRAAVVGLSKEQSPYELKWNLRYAVAMARLKYFRSPAALPTSREGCAEMWVRVYNAGGKGTPEKFLKAWRQVGLT